MNTERSLISLTGIEQASRSIAPAFLGSPQLEFEGLSRELGCRCVLKVATLNPIRSFKGRGTDWFVRSLRDSTPLVTASAGNFGQGMAYAARRAGIPLTVFASVNATPMKLERMRAFGAEVILEGADFDAAKTAARDHAARTGARFVEDGKDPAIAEGAGSMAVELLRGTDRFDEMAIAVGNGAMINGMATWAKRHSSSTRIVGVCAAAAPSMERSWRTGRIVTTETANTIADGIAVRVPVPEAVADMRSLVDEVLLVDDESVLRAMRLLLEHTGILAEPSGAVGIAAILGNRERFAGRRVATVLCGGNAGREQMLRWLA